MRTASTQSDSNWQYAQGNRAHVVQLLHMVIATQRRLKSETRCPQCGRNGFRGSQHDRHDEDQID